MSQNFFPLLGVAPQIGRQFSAEECKWNGPKVAMLSHGLWVRRFASDPGIVGRTLTLDNAPVTVVGVMPADFDFASIFAPASRIDLYFPFPLSDETNRWGNTMAIVGRLKPGVSTAQAQAEVKLIGAQLNAAHMPNRNDFEGWVAPLNEHVSGRLRLALIVLSCGVGAVMLIVCANLSNLLLARMAARRKGDRDSNRAGRRPLEAGAADADRRDHAFGVRRGAGRGAGGGWNPSLSAAGFGEHPTASECPRGFGGAGLHAGDCFTDGHDFRAGAGASTLRRA